MHVHYHHIGKFSVEAIEDDGESFIRVSIGGFEMFIDKHEVDQFVAQLQVATDECDAMDAKAPRAEK